MGIALPRCSTWFLRIFVCVSDVPQLDVSKIACFAWKLNRVTGRHEAVDITDDGNGLPFVRLTESRRVGHFCHVAL